MELDSAMLTSLMQSVEEGQPPVVRTRRRLRYRCADIRSESLCAVEPGRHTQGFKRPETVL